MKSRTCFQPSQPPLEAEGAKESPCPGGLCGNPAKQGTEKKKKSPLDITYVFAAFWQVFGLWFLCFVVWGGLFVVGWLFFK